MLSAPVYHSALDGSLWELLHTVASSMHPVLLACWERTDDHREAPGALLENTVSGASLQSHPGGFGLSDNKAYSIVQVASQGENGEIIIGLRAAQGDCCSGFCSTA